MEVTEFCGDILLEEKAKSCKDSNLNKWWCDYRGGRNWKGLRLYSTHKQKSKKQPKSIKSSQADSCIRFPSSVWTESQSEKLVFMTHVIHYHGCSL